MSERRALSTLLREIHVELENETNCVVSPETGTLKRGVIYPEKSTRLSTLLAKLRRFAVESPHGLINANLRRIAWPLLLRIAPSEGGQLHYCPSTRAFVLHCNCVQRRSSQLLEGAFDELLRGDVLEDNTASGRGQRQQVRKDILRSMFHFDVNRPLNEPKRAFVRAELEWLVNVVLEAYAEQLHYIQGYHDVVSIFLLVCGRRDALELSRRVSLVHIRDALRDSLGTVSGSLELTMPLLGKEDKQLHAFVESTQIPSSIFALSWVLTWFSHDLDCFDDVCRVYDLLLASPPIMCLYVCVSVMIELRDGLLGGDGRPPDVSTLIKYYQKLPGEINMHSVAQRAVEMFGKHPPEELLKEAGGRLPADSPMHATDMQQVDELLLQCCQAQGKCPNVREAESAEEEQQEQSGTRIRSVLSVSVQLSVVLGALCWLWLTDQLILYM